MKRNILIIEDIDRYMNALRNILESISAEINIYCATDLKQAYQLAMEYHIHLFLIDIILDIKKAGDISGLAFAQEMRKTDKYKFTPLIFITSLEDPKLYSYSQLHCFAFIEKPFSNSQVRDTIVNALEFPIKESDDKIIFFRKDRIVYSVSKREIIYIELSRRKIVIHCINDELEIPYITSEEMLKKLDSDSFLQCSRYCIVNKNYIEQVDYTNRFIKFKNIEDTVDLGIAMKKMFKQRLENE